MPHGLLDLPSYGWSGPFVDRTQHAPGVRLRPERTSFRALVLHRIGDALDAPPAEGRDAAAIIRFFTADPEGVATVTLDGSYESKKETIARWRAHGIPAEFSARAFVPYTFLIELDGTVNQMLPLEAVGAHAVGYNASGFGIACIGDFRVEPPSQPQLDAGVAVCTALLKCYGVSAAAIQIASHDEVRDPPKDCPGPLFPLDLVRSRIAAGS